ncbi:alpha/beta hydrolase fold domain-containing protein [Sphingobium sp. BS19]|uniref:alpha/beta hydrolase fold domain-containing protein n=1 Tax=Sphingobium sp. BS19 TaxID=3018973 RepID=UPI0024903779|nr:alpha/beta hydrolase [Sphingobium sp. BS19]
MHAAALRPAAFGPPKRIRRDVSVDYATLHNWPVYTVTPTARASDKTLVYIHGGAFYGEITAFHWRLIARIAADTGTRVTVPIYPLVPRGTADNVIDTIAAITTSEVERSGAGVVSLAGDSAGGAIALAVALQLNKAGVSLRQTVLIHPVVDLSLSNPEIAVVERRDPILRAAALRPILERWSGDLDIQNPRVSPLYDDLGGLGPLTIFSGTHDITNPDTRLLVDHARAAGVQIVYHEGEGLIHASVALPTREGREARRLILEALR